MKVEQDLNDIGSGRLEECMYNPGSVRANNEHDLYKSGSAELQQDSLNRGSTSVKVEQVAKNLKLEELQTSRSPGSRGVETGIDIQTLSEPDDRDVDQV